VDIGREKTSFLAFLEDYREMRQPLPKRGTNPKSTDRFLFQNLTSAFEFLADSLSGFIPISFALSPWRIAEADFSEGLICRAGGI
jgi:hypothetical protein